MSRSHTGDETVDANAATAAELDAVDAWLGTVEVALAGGARAVTELRQLDDVRGLARKLNDEDRALLYD